MNAASPPRISILLPYKNAAATLDACLHSIWQQTFGDYELLAVDDGSSDLSREIISRHMAQDPRIRALHNPGRGLIPALNHGLEMATAPLIARMDADDLMRPRRLEAQYRYLMRHPGIALLGCATRPFPNELISDGFKNYIQWQNGCNDPRQIHDEIYIESPFAHPSVMFRRERVLRLGGYRAGDFPEDYELWLRMHSAGERMAKLPQILLEWRDHPQRTSRTDPRCERAAFDRLRAHYLARDPRLLARRHELVIWGAGRKTRQRCRLLLDQGFELQAWIDIDPKKVGNRVGGAWVQPPEWLASGKRPFVLVYVTNHGAREMIATDLHAMGYRRGEDYLMVG